MRALMIDPAARQITEVEHDESDAVLRSLLHGEITSTTVVAGLAKGDALYVGAASQFKFQIKGVLAPIYGRALICGHTEDGDLCDYRTQHSTAVRLVCF